ncbi:hypothetical protein SLEP1_g33221 [Rubroshorea leprosula]|uniref:BED-type domain-containing protein n=1 Tax=Rubroshorea leprosula TaxID=152421 RepID=A0AAV5KFX4_9ROSI|nr:hypothetical protein SLEP1_g33221 [Rubroshorea leprosula]
MKILVSMKLDTPNCKAKHNIPRETSSNVCHSDSSSNNSSFSSNSFGNSSSNNNSSNSNFGRAALTVAPTVTALVVVLQTYNMLGENEGRRGWQFPSIPVEPRGDPRHGDGARRNIPPRGARMRGIFSPHSPSLTLGLGRTIKLSSLTSRSTFLSHSCCYRSITDLLLELLQICCWSCYRSAPRAVTDLLLELLSKLLVTACRSARIPSLLAACAGLHLCLLHCARLPFCLLHCAELPLCLLRVSDSLSPCCTMPDFLSACLLPMPGSLSACCTVPNSLSACCPVSNSFSACYPMPDSLSACCPVSNCLSIIKGCDKCLTHKSRVVIQIPNESSGNFMASLGPLTTPTPTSSFAMPPIVIEEEEGVNENEKVGHKRALTSKAWESFKRQKVNGTWKAICIYCSKMLGGETKNGTKHLHDHLKACPLKCTTDIRGGNFPQSLWGPAGIPVTGRCRDGGHFLIPQPLTHSWSWSDNQALKSHLTFNLPLPFLLLQICCWSCYKYAAGAVTDTLLELLSKLLAAACRSAGIHLADC